MNNDNGNNTNIRPNSYANTNTSPATNRKLADFSIRMTLDPNFVKKYAGLSDDIIKSTEVDYKREEYVKHQTRGSKRDQVKNHKTAGNKKAQKNTTENLIEDEDPNDPGYLKEREIIEAVKGLKLRLNPTPKYSNHSPYAPEMADPIELAIEVQRMELSE